MREFVDVESGRKDDRPKLHEAIRLCQITKSTLIIAKLDRLSRDVHFLTGLLQTRSSPSFSGPHVQAGPQHIP